MAGRRKQKWADFEAPPTGSKKFTRITCELVNSAAWRELSPTAVKLLISLRMEYDGKNAVVALTYQQAREKTGIASNATLKKAFTELWQRGFIEPVRMGGGGHNGKSPNLYRLSGDWQKTIT